MAGTLESSDAQITVEPGEDGIELTLESSVMNMTTGQSWPMPMRHWGSSTGD